MLMHKKELHKIYFMIISIAHDHYLCLKYLRISLHRCRMLTGGFVPFEYLGQLLRTR